MRRFRILVSSGGSDTSVKGGSQDNLARGKKWFYRFWRVFPIFGLFFRKFGAIFDRAIIQFRPSCKSPPDRFSDRADGARFEGKDGRSQPRRSICLPARGI